MATEKDTKANNAVQGKDASLEDLITDQRAQYGKLLDLNGDEFLLPTYTIKEVYDAIPKHCFERNLIKGVSYVVQDIIGLAVTFLLFNTFATPQYVHSYGARVALWSLYTFIQGIWGLGIWVLAHECGHHAMSTSKVFDDTLGLLLHTSLLVPYFSWRVSHRNHHKAVGNMSTDTSFVPYTRMRFATRFGKTMESIAEYAEDSPIYTFFYLLFHQLLDWPIYMLLMIGFGEHWYQQQEKMSKEKEVAKRHADGTLVRTYPVSSGHLSPHSPMYKARDAKYIFLTDVALAGMLSLLYYLGATYGWMNIAVWYGVPYLWVNQRDSRAHVPPPLRSCTSAL